MGCHATFAWKPGSDLLYTPYCVAYKEKPFWSHAKVCEKVPVNAAILLLYK